MASTAQTLGELKRSGYQARSIRDEIRQNLLDRLREGAPVFQGVVGYDNTVIPQVINALLAKHNFILLGLRGQAKTRILRGLVELLDEQIPVVAGSELNDDPFNPVSAYARKLVAEKGDDTPIAWIDREARYREKLATPDVSIADLIGDLDPVKAAVEKLSFSHEEVINYGIIPRTNRGIFGINELPDLQPRIQVGLFNILEEKDVQIRGFPVRLPMDILLVFTANPEDYTNRGSIITPLKDRIESQIMTHYPAHLGDALSITEQEAWRERENIQVEIPESLRHAIERIAFVARDSEFVDQASGVSARLPIAALENVISNAERRAALTGSKQETLRVLDIWSALPAMTGKLELVYEGEQEGPQRVVNLIIGKALRAEFETLFPSGYEEPKRGRQGQQREEPQQEDTVYKPVIDHFALGRKLELSDTMSFDAYLKALREVESLEKITKQYAKPKNDYELASMMEFVLEGLHQSSLLAKEDLDRGILYSDMLGAMYSS